ncbi:phospholipase A1 2-like [Condylostylus longicornis]|uniref:phospholipase A1 2-like n=1 Tax=Condylostylus longicornis TaxID=2530218 RepID=UPI00244DADFA|nr:phospholipase A1 2-like [Condylostylus longicornis]
MLLLPGYINPTRIFPLLLLIIVPAFSIIVDYDNCVKFSPLTIYPPASNPQMRYYLFTPNNQIEGEEIIYQDFGSLDSSHFNKQWRTRLFVGGWKVFPNNCRTALLKDAYYEAASYDKPTNFIIADWSDWNTQEYPFAVADVAYVGELIGDFINFLYNYGVPYDNIYIIGHSLGAHVAGAAGSSIKPNQVNTIFGLDPDGVVAGVTLSHILNPNDAAYVEAIITDMIAGLGYSLPGPIGDAQCYPHFGQRYQPSCSVLSTDQFCSHAVAVDYFANSLGEGIEFCAIPTTFPNMVLSIAPQDDGLCTYVMGGDPSQPKNGILYVPTQTSVPLPP